MGRASKAGTQMAKAVIEWLNMMYNVDTIERVLDTLIDELQAFQYDNDEKITAKIRKRIIK